MATYVEIVTQQLMNVGFFDIIIFMLTSAIFYGLFKKSELLGKSNSLNAIVSISIGFLVLAFRVVTGVSIIQPIATFFTQWMILILALFIGVLVASLFYPNLPKFLAERFTRKSTLSAMIAMGIALLVTSGLISIFWSTGGGPPGAPGSSPMPPLSVIAFSAGLIIFLVILIIAASVATSQG